MRRHRKVTVPFRPGKPRAFEIRIGPDGKLWFNFPHPEVLRAVRRIAKVEVVNTLCG